MAQPDFSILRPVDVAGSFLGAYDQEKARQAQAAQQMFLNQQATERMGLARQEEARQTAQHAQDAAYKAAQIKKLGEDELFRIEPIPVGGGMLREHAFYKSGRFEPVGEPFSKEELMARRAASGAGGAAPMLIRGVDNKGRVYFYNRADLSGKVQYARNPENPADYLYEAQYDPNLTGLKAGAAAKAKAEAERASGAEGSSEVVEAAENLLTGRATGVKPTQSASGALIDTVAAVFGKTPKGATEAQRLDVLGNTLASKVPRLEGPQSDADRAYYQSMAGQISDRTIPVDRRLAALQEVKKTLAKYDKQGERWVWKGVTTRGEMGGEPQPGQPAQPPKGALVPVASESEAMKLPVGTRFRLPDGRTGTAR